MTSAGAIVLAGGRSTRMGTPKAQLDWHGVPLVVHVATTLAQALAGGPVVVVGAPGHPLPPLPPGVLLVEDAHPGRGPLEGLAAGLEALAPAAELAVAVATDQPFVAAVVERLVSAAGEHDAVAFEVEGRLQPLGAVYRTSLTRTVAQRLAAADDTSLRGLLAAVDTRRLAATPSDGAALISLDTRELYDRALAADQRG